MDWLVEQACRGVVEQVLCRPFAYGFMQRALVAGLLAVAATSVVGTWMVLRGLSFLGDALAHGVIPGIALGVLVGFDLNLGAVLAAVVMVAAINLVHRRAGVTEDTGIGLLFVGMLALGVIIMSRTDSYTGSLTTILFGDALGVDRADIAVVAATALAVVPASLVFYRPLLVLSFNQDKAEVLGLAPRLAHLGLLGLITLAVVGSFHTVGTLLVFGLLVGPPATATLLVRSVPAVMLTAVLLGVGAVVAGLVVSFHADTASSATMAGIAVAMFFAVLLGREAWWWVRGMMLSAGRR
ncbi:MAG: metal ABC transporter permease [Actinomycetota bacterium]|nr:metal ABC transporter permease [Actinomycetota bacterium]